jgi:GT2 family glycosyltransferase
MIQRIAGRVSFIIPAYNAAAYLEETLQSVLSQNYPDIEVIVVDDGSNDRSYEIASNYPDSRVRAIQQRNGGPSAARNTGFRHSTGEFIWYLDADDLLVDGCVAPMVASLQLNPETGFVVGAWRTTDAKGADFSGAQHIPFDTTPAELYSQMLLRTVFPVGSAVFRALAVEASGGWDESLWCAEDRDFYLRVLDGHFKFKSTAMDVFRYRIHESNATFNTDRIQTHANRFLQKWFGPQGRAETHHRSLGSTAQAIVDLYIARQCMITNQPNKVNQFTESAAVALLHAQPGERETTQILWETTANPRQELIRTSLWKHQPEVVSQFCKAQAIIALRARKPWVALTWLFERVFHGLLYLLPSISKTRAGKMAANEAGQP